MKEIAGAVNKMNQHDINHIESQGSIEISAGIETISLSLTDVEITSEDIPGWLVANEGTITVALDITITEELRYEGIARELVNRIQNIRKDNDFDVTDKVNIQIEKHKEINDTINRYADYISLQTLAESIELSDKISNSSSRKIEIDQDIHIQILVTKKSN
jgi:isoleucyl-tRNA synthetase